MIKLSKKDFSDNLFSISKKEFGDNYMDKLFEQYKIYVEMAKSNDVRKGTTNSFFLSINTGLLSALGFLFTLGISTSEITSLWIFGGSAAGILFAYAWVRTVVWFSQLNRARWKIIQEIEKKLPLSIYDTEWVALGEGKDKKLYKPLSGVEKMVPKVFIGFYSLLIVLSILLGFGILEIGNTIEFFF